MKILLIYQNYFYEYYFNIKYIILFIDRIFLNQILKKKKNQINIKKISFIKIRKLKNKKYNIYEYVIILIYIFNKNNKIILIRREIHIVEFFLIKIFINIDIIKPEKIILNINKKIIIIKSCDDLQISMFMIINFF